MAAVALLALVCLTTALRPTHAHAAVSSPAGDGAYVSRVHWLSPRVLDLTVSSPAMGGPEPVRVILPQGWTQQRTRRFPALYLLQGAGDDYTSWTRETDVVKLASTADFLVVMPDGGRAGFYSDWWDFGRPDPPRWETFHTEELIQLMERDFRANTARAIIGLSEGGTGALDYAARHRGAFRYAGSFSGIVDTGDPLSRLVIAATCLREGIDPLRLWGDPQLHPDIWDSHNPSSLTRQLRGTQVHLSVGNGEPGTLDTKNDVFAQMLEAPLYSATARYADALRAAGVDVTANLYSSGTHSWPYWQRELHVVWPAVSAALTRGGN